MRTVGQYWPARNAPHSLHNDVDCPPWALFATMAADPFTVAPGELATPVLIAIGCLVLFVLLLAIQGKKAPAPVPHEVADLGNHGEKGMTSTVFVEENGQVVRRSTRSERWAAPPCHPATASSMQQSKSVMFVSAIGAEPALTLLSWHECAPQGEEAHW